MILVRKMFCQFNGKKLTPMNDGVIFGHDTTAKKLHELNHRLRYAEAFLFSNSQHMPE